MDPTLDPFNFEPTGLTPEQIAQMIPQQGAPANIPPPAMAPPAPHPLEGIIPRMLSGVGGLFNPTPPAPRAAMGVGGEVARDATPAPVGGAMPEAIAGQLARWGVSPKQILPGLGQPPGGPSVGALLSPGMGVGGEVARDAAAASLPAGATPASGMAPTTPATATRNPFQGLTMPTAPSPQRVSTPSAPRPTGTIKSGELMALLQSLGMGPQQAGGLPLPTLASVVGR
jgi:hypothetical protein